VIGGYLFLVAIIDLFSRKVVGWSLGDRLDPDLSGEALRRALARRNPPPGLIFHTDRGSEFAARSFRDLLSQAHALQSMSRKGNCWDNAVAESFFATLKVELVYQTQWCTRAQARTAIFEYIELFYNRRRRHSAIGYLSPNQFELRHHEPMAA
jgi:transposase InsO family protein